MYLLLLYCIIYQVDLEFGEENDSRVQLIVHSLKPPFLTSGKNGTKAAFGIKQKVCSLVSLVCTLIHIMLLHESACTV
jgi:hypothetical protein